MFKIRSLLQKTVLDPEKDINVDGGLELFNDYNILDNSYGSKLGISYGPQISTTTEYNYELFEFGDNYKLLKEDELKISPLDNKNFTYKISIPSSKTLGLSIENIRESNDNKIKTVNDIDNIKPSPYKFDFISNFNNLDKLDVKLYDIKGYYDDMELLDNGTFGINLPNIKYFTMTGSAPNIQAYAITNNGDIRMNKIVLKSSDPNDEITVEDIYFGIHDGLYTQMDYKKDNSVLFNIPEENMDDEIEYIYLKKLVFSGNSDPNPISDEENITSFDEFFEEPITQGLKYLLINIDGIEGYKVYTSYGDQVDSDIVIPSYYNGLPVIQTVAFFTDVNTLKLGKNIINIGYNSFQNKNISSIKFPEGLKYIEDNAFILNNLTGTIETPMSLISINHGAFAENDITEIIINENVSNIGSSILRKNYNLEKVVIYNESKVHGLSRFTDINEYPYKYKKVKMYVPSSLFNQYKAEHTGFISSGYVEFFTLDELE